MSTKDDLVMPFPALVLGVAGLVPFIGLPVISVLYSGLIKSETVFALIAYGAVILSFLGGVHWGVALGSPHQQSWMRLIISVIPSLFAWAAVLMAEHQALLLLTVSFAIMLLIDVQTTRRRIFPRWYIRLRWLLTTIVCLSLTATLIGLR